MTRLKFHHHPTDRSLISFMDDILKTTTPAFKSSVPVNISESNDGYKIDVISPGFTKSDFNVHIEKGLLTISLEKANQHEENVKQLHTEYHFSNFKRSFTINEKVDAENITATYVNGILTLNLPVKAEVKEPVKQIIIQ